MFRFPFTKWFIENSNPAFQDDRAQGLCYKMLDQRKRYLPAAFSTQLGNLTSFLPAAAMTVLVASGPANAAEPVGKVVFGAGFNDAYGANLRFGLTHNQFLGRDQTIDVGAQVGEDGARYQLFYNNEKLSGGNPVLGVSAFFTQKFSGDLFHFESQSVGVTPSLTWRLNDDSSLKVLAKIGADDLNGFAPDASWIITAEPDSRQYVGLGVAFSRQLGGFGLDLATLLQGTSENQTMLKTTAALSGGTTAGPAELEMRLKGGTIKMLDRQSSVLDRFLIGGNGLRGFAYGGLGPRDTRTLDNQALGGTNFASLQLDARFPGMISAAPNIVLGVFFDVGAVWGLDASAADLSGRALVDDGFDLRSAAGVTLGYAVDAGRLEMSLGGVLSSRSFDEKQQLQIAFTADF